MVADLQLKAAVEEEQEERERLQPGAGEVIPSAQALSGRKEEVFPGFWWEPRSSREAARFSGGRKPKVLTKAQWTYAAEMFGPLWWYLKNLEFAGESADPPSAETDTHGARQTPWPYLAVDFKYTGGFKLCGAADDEATMRLTTMVKYISHAMRAVYKLCRVKQHLQDVMCGGGGQHPLRGGVLGR